MNKELQYALEREAAWRDHKKGWDHGSYCEDPANETTAACRIVTKYKELADLLLAYERNGYRIAPAWTVVKTDE